jgi:hypothetical protein
MPDRARPLVSGFEGLALAPALLRWTNVLSRAEIVALTTIVVVYTHVSMRKERHPLQRFLLPTKAQWKQWRLLSKLGFFGSWASIVAIPLAVALYLLSLGDRTKIEVQPNGIAQIALGNSNTHIQTQIVNNGVSKEEMRQLLKERYETPNQQIELAKRYPQGYALLGVANGTFIFHPKFKQFSFSADWDKTTILHDPNQSQMALSLSHFALQTPELLT